MGIKSYKKLSPNPLWLGKGLTITTDTFTDKDFNDVNKAKLKAAKRVNLVKEVKEVDAVVKTATDTDNRISELEEEYERAVKERDDALQKLAALQEGEIDAWVTMSEEELAKTYTVPELRKIIRDEFEDYILGRGLKEAQLAKIIVELVKEANTEFDATLNDVNEGTGTEDSTGETGEGTKV